ncbi:MAG: cytochrome c [Myxococcota bacterium]
MLSKSQARLFFLSATGGFSLVFLGLTADTIRQTPARTHQEAMTPAVVRGKEIFDRNNCMGCHTILGEGAYYAPELTKVVDRRGEGWIRLFLKDPAAMFPNERKMVQYDFTDAQIDDLVAFFGWIGRIDTNGFPPAPDLAPPPPPPVAGPRGVSVGTAPDIFDRCLCRVPLGGRHRRLHRPGARRRGRPSTPTRRSTPGSPTRRP